MATPFDKLMSDSGPSSFDSAMGVHEFDTAMSSGSGALEGYEAGLSDFVKNLGGLASGAAHLIKNPSEIAGVVSEGAGAIGHSVMHPIDLAKGIIWDGIVKPVLWNNVRQVFDPSLSQEDRFTLGRESALGMAGLALGEGAGRAISLLGRGAEASVALKALTKASTVDEMVDVVSKTLTPKEALLAASHAQEAASKGGYIKAALRTAPVGAGSGFAMGVAQTNDPNEAFKQGLVNGMVGAFLGPVFHSLSKGVDYSKVRMVGIERARDDMFTSLIKNAPDVTLDQAMKGVDFVRVGAQNLSEGEGFIFHDLPDYISTDNLPENAIVREGKGKKSVLIVGEPPLTMEDIVSRAKTGEGTVGATMDRSLLKKLGANMYKGQLGSVIVKEGIQNAVDAVKAMPGAKGKVSVSIDDYEGRYEFHDNGIGMSPDVAANQFMDVGGSLKPGAESSGGYGLAKVGLLSNAEQFTMSTVTDMGGKKVRTTISGSADDWVEGKLKFETQQELPDASTGTSLAIKIPKDANRYGSSGVLKRMIERSRFKNIQISDMSNPDSYKPIETEPGETFDLPNANVEFHHSTEMVELQDYGRIEVHVLNNGLYQFTAPEEARGVVPRSITVDVHPKVDVEDTKYPFTTSREELKSGVEIAVKKYLKTLSITAAKKEAFGLIKTLKESPKIPGTDLSVMDTSQKIDSKMVDKVVKLPATKLLAETYHNIVHAIADILQEKSDQISGEGDANFKDFIFGGIGIGKGYLGLNISSAALNLIAKAAKIEGTGIEKNVILVNPFTTFREILKVDAMNPGQISLHERLADHSIGTLIHEIVHERARGHDEDFSGVLTRAIGVMMDDGGHYREQLALMWDTVLRNDDFNNVYEELQDAYREGKDAFKSISTDFSANDDAGSSKHSNEKRGEVQPYKSDSEIRRGAGLGSGESIRTGEPTSETQGSNNSFDKGTAKGRSDKLERYISVDDALGSALKHDMLDPSFIDPATGDPALIAKAGTKLTPEIAKELSRVGYEHFTTDKGEVALEWQRKSGIPDKVTSVTLDVNDEALGRPPSDEPLGVETRPGRESDRLDMSSSYKVGDVVSRAISKGRRSELVKYWKENGFVPNQLIEFKGVDHQFLGIEKGYASIRDLTTGRVHRTLVKNIELKSGRIVQVEYKPGEDLLIGKKFTNPDNPNMFAVLSKNTKVGEKPWRVTYFVKDAKGNIDNYIHHDYETADAASSFVTAAPSADPIMGFKGVKSSDKIQGYVEADSKSVSKPGEIISRLDTPFQVQTFPQVINKDLVDAIAESPEDYTIYKENVDRAVNEQFDEAHKYSTSLATNGLIAERMSDGSYEVSSSKGFVGRFDSLTKLYDFADGLSGGGGDLIPGVPGVRSVGFDDSGSFALNQKRNFVNALRDWVALRASVITTPYSYFTALETKYGRKFFNEFFLPLQHARTAYNLRLAGLAEHINPLLARVSVLKPERKGLISDAQEAFSAAEMRSNKPSILSRALNKNEIRVGDELGANSTHDDRVVGYQYIRSEIQLKEELKGKSKEEMNRIAADFIHAFKDITPVQKKVIEIMKSVRGESIDDISLYAVNRLADAIENKSMSREDFMNHHSFNKEERAIVNEIEKVYRVLGDEFEIDKGSRLGGYITHAINYDGKVVDGSVITNSRWLPAKTRDFIYAAVRTGEMQDLIRDPGVLLLKYVTQGARTEKLYPEIAKAKTWLQTAYSGLDKGTAEAINSKATSYMNQILGQIDPQDALVASETINKASGAFINTLNRMGIRDGTTEKWLKNYFRISELATQGYKPIAGLRDATSWAMYMIARFGIRRLAATMRDWNTATETKGILQESGKIPGLTLEFFIGMDGALNGKTFLEKVAESGFKYSGQPYVYQQFHAMVYINTIKTVLNAAADLEAGKITQKTFEKRIGLHTYDLPQAKQFTSLLRGQPLEAAKYLADVTGREVVGYYGMANHPFFMSSKGGKILGQHGQWPLWMVQNFGRLASQGSRPQRLMTAAKIGAMFAAIQYGGRAAGFNLGSWTFSPDNAIFLGGPLAQTGMWGAIYLGTNDPTQREFATRMLERATRTDRSQYFLPMPSQVYNLGWGLARQSNGDPAPIVFGQMMGLPIDQAQYPKP